MGDDGLQNKTRGALKMGESHWADMFSKDSVVCYIRVICTSIPLCNSIQLIPTTLIYKARWSESHIVLQKHCIHL